MHLISTLSFLENLTQSVCGLVRSAPLNASRRMASWECEASCPSDKKEVSSVHKLWFPQDNTGSRLYQRDNVIINIIWHKMSKAKSRGKEKYQLAGQGVIFVFLGIIDLSGFNYLNFFNQQGTDKKGQPEYFDLPWGTNSIWYSLSPSNECHPEKGLKKNWKMSKPSRSHQQSTLGMSLSRVDASTIPNMDSGGDKPQPKWEPLRFKVDATAPNQGR